MQSRNHPETQLKLIGRGLSDKIIFDDISLTEFFIAPQSPPYGATIETSPLNLTWSIPEDDRVFTVAVELSQDNDFKNKTVLGMFSPQGNSLKIKERLASGKWFWRLTLFHNRERLASSDVFWFSLPYPLNTMDEQKAGSKTFEKRKNKLINPPPPFPVGLYQAEIGAFEEYKQAGFNLVQSYNSESDYIKKFVKAARDRGLSALVTKRMTPTGSHLAKFFKEIREEPGLYGWYIEDEPEGRGISPSLLWQWRNYILSHDPGHPTAVANLRSRKVGDYAPAVDIVMIDPYPIPHMPVTWLSDSIDEARRAVSDRKPVWAVIQAFNWANEGAQFAKGKGRYPTLEEERCLTYLSIIHGVNGLMYFSYPSARINDPEEANWKNVKRVVSELKEIQPLLLAPELKASNILSVSDSIRSPVSNMQNQNAGSPEDLKKPIHYMVKQLGPTQLMNSGVYIIAVNVSGQPVGARFSGPILSGASGKVLFEERNVVIHQSGFQDYFDPCDVHIYRIE